MLVPSPDYPLWTAAVTLEPRARGALPVPPRERASVPDPEELAQLISARTRALVIINPNNPTGAVYLRAVLVMARLAEERRISCSSAMRSMTR